MLRSKPSLSIVIPAYNEERRIEASIISVKRFLRQWTQEHPADLVEVIYVIEKSTDQTLKLAEKTIDGHPFIKLIGNDVQKGKGYAVKTGMLAASGSVHLYMDCDLSTDLKHVSEFLAAMRKDKFNVLVGDRKTHGARVEKQPLLRTAASYVFSSVIKLLSISSLRDTQCGFKAFDQRSSQILFSRLETDGFTFDVELIIKAQNLGLSISSLPVVWVNDNNSKINVLRHGIEMLIDLLHYKYKFRNFKKETQVILSQKAA